MSYFETVPNAAGLNRVPSNPFKLLDFSYLNLADGETFELATGDREFLAVLLGVWELHQTKMATRELLWQYRNQLGHFERARMHLERITSMTRRDEILVKLGRDSLMESYLWTIHRYHREHEPPASA